MISSAHLVMYSCALWIGFRVWNPDHPAPAAGLEERPDRGGIPGVLREFDGDGAIDQPDLAAEVDAARRAQVRDARVRGFGRAVDLARFEILVGRPSVGELDHGDDAPIGRLERRLGAEGETRRGLVRDGERDRQGPDGAVLEPPLAHDAQVVALGHEPLEGGERAVRDRAPDRSRRVRRAESAAARLRDRAAAAWPRRGRSGRRARRRAAARGPLAAARWVGREDGGNRAPRASPGSCRGSRGATRERCAPPPRARAAARRGRLRR